MRKLISILLIVNQTYLYGQVSQINGLGKNASSVNNGEYSTINDSIDLIDDKDEFISKANNALSVFYSVKEVSEAIGFPIDREIRFNIATNNINAVLNNFSKSLLDDFEVKTAYNNLSNYKKTLQAFKSCTDNDRKLCEGSLSYLSNQYITREAKPYKQNPVKTSLINDGINSFNDLIDNQNTMRNNLGSVKNEIYKNTIINVVKTILELQYRYKELNIYNDLKVSDLYRTICQVYKGKDFCSDKHLNIKTEIEDFINKYPALLEKMGVERRV